MNDYTYYNNGYGYDTGAAATGLAAVGIGLLIFWLIGMAIGIFTIICNWKVFKKAGKPGWASIIPVYNIIVMIEIAQLPMWYIALFFVPIANVYAIIKINIEIAHKFGKSTGFGIGMALLQPVFYAMLAFGKNVSYGGAGNFSQPTYQQPVQPQPVVQPVMPEPVQPQPVVQPVMPEPVQPQPVVQPMMQEPVQPQPVVQPVMQEPVQPQPVVQPIMQEPVQPQMQSTGSTFCTNCGGPLMPNAKFCTRCGKQL